MLKRLIEVALPLKEVSEQSAREKSIRHGHISTLHIWWARRPLATCRAVVFASLIPDPDDPECPDSFPALVNELLPKTPNGEDTPRNRCLEFIKHLVRWENSNNEELIGKARKLIAAAHKFLHPESKDELPKVLDPFAGGGAIPLEALRLGCEAHAIELNPGRPPDRALHAGLPAEVRPAQQPPHAGLHQESGSCARRQGRRRAVQQERREGQSVRCRGD